MKKIIALILALILTLSVSPLAFASSQGGAQQRDIWDMISDIEQNAARKTRANNVESLTDAYRNAVDEMIEAVEASSDYVPGTLERHGNFFFWVDTKGDPNGYSPSYRAKRQIGAIPGAVVGGTTEVVNYGVKGGSPSSIDVAAFQPYIGIDSSFTAQYETRCNAIAQATGGVGTTYKQSNANVNNLGIALDSCGVVIFDSHGTTDYDSWDDYTSQANSSYLCLTTSTGITNADKSSAQGEFGTYYHAFSLGGGDWAVDGTAITNHMNGTAPNSMVWMAICLGMATDGLEAPFHDRGAEVVYGYSQSVTFTGDYKYEGFFWPYMCQDHTVAEACAYMKTKSNCDWDPAYSGYSYSQAVANHVAFPIVSSSEDPYLGHGNVDVIQVPNSLWTLFNQFNIAACSNNDAWGTVTVSGRQITATPAVGYEVAGYEVLSGTCTVTQNGNVFQVQAETDCEIQINFAARIPAVVNFVAPEGVSVENYSGYVGDEISLPAPVGEPLADAYHYSFLGWTTADLTEDSQEMPNYQKSGTAFTVAAPQTTYYALYKYFVAEDGVSEGSFKLVTSAPASWAGDYVITYQGNRLLDASGEITGSSIGGSAAARYLEDVGAILDGDALYNVPDDVIYTAEPAGNGGYTLKMKDHEVYLALTSDSNALMTAVSGANKKAQWLLSMNSQGVQIANALYTERTLRFNNTNKGLFRCYKTGQEQISVYSSGNGVFWFTTNPRFKTVCDQHSFGDWTQIKAPGCTEPGTEKRVCTVCGYAETRELPALGHDYNAVVTNPTCTEQGFTTYTCSRCGDSYVDNYVDALGHAFSEWTETTAPSCTEPGEESRLCARCLTTETRPVDALGHDFGDWTVTTAPSCTEAGTETRSCSRCDEVETRPVDALGHTPAEPVKENETAPSCTEPGGYDLVTKCSVCGVELSREHIEIPAPGHTPAEPVKENETAPSCTEPGGYDMVTKCSVCGVELSREHVEIPALGHAWDEGTVTVEPTESTPGVRTFTCTVCGATREEEIPVLDHDCKIAHFVDLEAYPYGTSEHAAIEWAFTHTPQITAGTDETHFTPEKELNRATAMTFLWAAAGKPNPKSTTSPFSDVKMGKWYTKAILWAAENKITSGNTDGSFGINTICNRGHILTFLYAQQGKPEYSIENPYSDVGNKWYTHGAIWAYENGIEKGENGKFNYKTPCTRVLAVTYIYRAVTGKGLVD